MAAPTTTVDAAGARVDAALQAAAADGDAAAGHAEELAQALVAFYGAGLARLLDALDASQVARLAEDPPVGSLLALHDLHPVPTGQRVAQALDRVRPYLGRHAGDVELVEVAETTVHLRLSGNCAGCPSSPETVRHAVEREVREAAPEVDEIVVDGLAPDGDVPTGGGTGAGADLLQIGTGPPHPYADAACPAPAPTQSREAPLPAVGPPAPAAPAAPAGADPAPAGMPTATAGAGHEAGRCELCATPVGEEHSHLAAVTERSIVCACRACWLLFTADGADQRYRAVPERYRHVPELPVTEGLWDRLAVPVGLAFFFYHSALERWTAFYPSPAGATESELALDDWGRVIEAVPALADTAPDVEAVLVHRTSARGEPTSCEAFLVPVDACYHLVGLVRRHWRGFDGGQEAWDAIDAFLAQLRTRGAAT